MKPFPLHPVDVQNLDDGCGRNPLLFDFWLGVDAGTRENGCLQLVPGSQKLGRGEHQSKGGILTELVPADHGYGESDIVYVETDPGDLIVWHQDMFHGSAPRRAAPKSRAASP